MTYHLLLKLSVLGRETLLRNCLIIFMMSVAIPGVGQDGVQHKVPVMVSHLPKSNQLILRMKNAGNHHIFNKVLCFKYGCRRAIGWQHAQKDKRFNDYKDVPQVRKAKKIKRPVEAEIHTTQPPVPPPDTAQIKQLIAPVKIDSIKEQRFILSDVLFDVNSPALKSDFTSRLDTLVGILQKKPTLQVLIIGHTDNTGRESYNERLSTIRAESVGLYLIENGIDPARIRFEGKGSREPIADNTFEEGRRKNRRVEIILRE